MHADNEYQNYLFCFSTMSPPTPSWFITLSAISPNPFHRPSNLNLIVCHPMSTAVILYTDALKMQIYL